MQRQMISELDAPFSMRNDGQLLGEQVVVTRPTRAGNMQAVPTEADLACGDAGLPGMGMVDLSVPVFGKVDWSSLLLGGIIGVVAWRITRNWRQDMMKRMRTKPA